MGTIDEAKSKWFAQAAKAKTAASDLYDYRNQLIGAVGSGELEEIIVNALKAATLSMRFAYDVLLQADDAVSESDAVKDAIGNLLVAAGKIKLVEGKQVTESADEEIFVDPYEAEYLPADMLTEVPAKAEVTESVNEDNDPLPDDLDDDPDAVITIDTDGMPVKFNNTPMDLDPFAVRLFRNNADLIDPPEVFDTVADAEVSVEPEIEPGEATSAEVNQVAQDQVIDAIADGSEKEDDDEEEKKKDIVIVDLPSDDFDVFASEGKRIKQESIEIPKATADGLPPKFKSANDNIAEDTGNNLKMLAFLANAGI